jgi:hypothetical protein
MTQGFETRLNGTTLVVRIPMAIPAARRPQVHTTAGRRRVCARDEATAGRNTHQGAGAGVAVATDA